MTNKWLQKTVSRDFKKENLVVEIREVKKMFYSNMSSREKWLTKWTQILLRAHQKKPYKKALQIVTEI